MASVIPTNDANATAETDRCFQVLHEIQNSPPKDQNNAGDVVPSTPLVGSSATNELPDSVKEVIFGLKTSFDKLSDKTVQRESIETEGKSIKRYGKSIEREGESVATPRPTRKRENPEPLGDSTKKRGHPRKIAPPTESENSGDSPRMLNSLIVVPPRQVQDFRIPEQSLTQSTVSQNQNAVLGADIIADIPSTSDTVILDWNDATVSYDVDSEIMSQLNTLTNSE
ncbi:hypothetical protein QAD02_013325 [Eretmocerus hayati]|uniref:Uncharacterized protein n=1 Tax=Eretmocerus hayati TaxID=131215 RepID=A0ACC2P357_9HYME|nr:hypothetical protein QAD02_013325 [Eretmocerus hayati]